jgi:hypothetical protein
LEQEENTNEQAERFGSILWQTAQINLFEITNLLNAEEIANGVFVVAGFLEKGPGDGERLRAGKQQWRFRCHPLLT